MATIDIFVGEWQEYNSVDFGKFLDALGVGMMKKAMATKLHPALTFKVDGETISLTMSAGPKSKTNSFKLGEEFESDGEQEGKGVASFDSSSGKLKVVVTPKDPKKTGVTVERRIENGELVQEMSVGSVKCTRHFKRK